MSALRKLKAKTAQVVQMKFVDRTSGKFLPNRLISSIIGKKEKHTQKEINSKLICKISLHRKQLKKLKLEAFDSLKSMTLVFIEVLPIDRRCPSTTLSIFILAH